MTDVDGSLEQSEIDGTDEDESRMDDDENGSQLERGSGRDTINLSLPRNATNKLQKILFEYFKSNNHYKGEKKGKILENNLLYRIRTKDNNGCHQQ